MEVTSVREWAIRRNEAATEFKYMNSFLFWSTKNRYV